MITGLSKRARCEFCGKPTPSWTGGFCYSCQGQSHEISKEKRKVDVDQYVYAISVKDDDSAVIKFGYTRSVGCRLAALQIGSPVRLELLARCQGLRHHEASIHRLLAPHRSHGEWFQRTKQTMDVVRAIETDTLIQFLAENGPRRRMIKHLQNQQSVS